jgi:hypothetical protein
MRNFTDYYLKECTGDLRCEAYFVPGVGECIYWDDDEMVNITFLATAWSTERMLTNAQIIRESVKGKTILPEAYVIDKDLSDAEVEELIHFAINRGFALNFHCAKARVFMYGLIDRMTEGEALQKVIRKAMEGKA